MRYTVGPCTLLYKGLIDKKDCLALFMQVISLVHQRCLFDYLNYLKNFYILKALSWQFYTSFRKFLNLNFKCKLILSYRNCNVFSDLCAIHVSGKCISIWFHSTKAMGKLYFLFVLYWACVLLWIKKPDIHVNSDYNSTACYILP